MCVFLFKIFVLSGPGHQKKDENLNPTKGDLGHFG